MTYTSHRNKHIDPEARRIIRAIHRNHGALPAYGCNSSAPWKRAEAAGWIWLDGVAQDATGTSTTTWRLTPMAKYRVRSNTL